MKTGLDKPRQGPKPLAVQQHVTGLVGLQAPINRFETYGTSPDTACRDVVERAGRDAKAVAVVKHVQQLGWYDVK